MPRFWIVLAAALLTAGGLGVRDSSRAAAAGCTNGVDWSISPNSPSSPPSYPFGATTVYAPVGAAAAVKIKSVAADSCEFDVYFSSAAGSTSYEFSGKLPKANSRLAANVPLDGLELMVLPSPSRLARAASPSPTTMPISSRWRPTRP